MTTEEKLKLALEMLENLCWGYTHPDPYTFRDRELGQYTDKELEAVGLYWLPKRDDKRKKEIRKVLRDLALKQVPYPYGCRIVIYKDDTNLFTEEEMNRDNMTDIGVPEEILRQWFEEKIAKDEPDMDFITWFEEESTADDTIGLYDFCIDHGVQPLLEE